MAKKYLIVIGGPTASGKTSTSIKLANHFDTVILNADSRQFYKEMSIGTAKPSDEELAQAPHHFINSLSIHDQYDVGDYEKEAIALLDEIYKTKDIAIVVGGSGLFIRALCDGLNSFPPVSPSAKTKVNEIETNQGVEGLQKALKEVDPDYYATVDKNNPRRLIRALEVSYSSGKPYSNFINQPKAIRAFTPVYVCMQWEREQLYARINKRVDLMLEQGLETETKALYPYKELRSLQTVGYQEVFDYYDKKIDFDTAIELIKRNSRRYAKRQMTWFRNDANEWKGFHPSEVKDLIDYINNIIE